MNLSHTVVPLYLFVMLNVGAMENIFYCFIIGTVNIKAKSCFAEDERISDPSHSGF